MTEQEFNSTSYGVKVRLINLYKPCFPGKITQGSHGSVYLGPIEGPFSTNIFEIFMKIREALAIPEEMLPTMIDGEGWIGLTSRVILKGQRAKIIEALKIYNTLLPYHYVQCELADEEHERERQEQQAKDDAKRFDQLYIKTVEELFIDKGILVPISWRR
jgi:hypothetical protein